MPDPVSSQTPQAGAEPSRAKQWAWRGLKLALTALVLVMVGRQIWVAYEEWRTQRAAVHAGWIALAGVSYVAGLSMYGLFWRLLLADAGVAVSRREALRAYLIGHLGKYVPGKAMVVVLRVGLLRTPGRSGVTIAVTVVYETLAMMAVGAAVALVTLGFTAPDRWRYWGGAVVAVLFLGAILHPAVFGRVSRVLTAPVRRKGGNVTPPPAYGTLVQGSVLLVMGWVLLGGSLLAVARAIDVDFSSATDVLLGVGATAMATVLGFAILFLPSGLGAREFVIMVLLQSRWGASAAVVAVLLRLVWMVAECCVAGVLYRWPMRMQKS